MDEPLFMCAETTPIYFDNVPPIPNTVTVKSQLLTELNSSIFKESKLWSHVNLKKKIYFYNWRKVPGDAKSENSIELLKYVNSVFFIQCSKQKKNIFYFSAKITW